ncbi:hypothetical protein F5X68DRAFT_63183 [Plectosphaerella plurivora]|uniref:Uncharacterized protein n=1 Tax=Plectosphaerella plurivora TaxID=936078 RepID=A0A9P9A540_9PEZI|nr:hypothetical protein F5X68DRAFT_63183 [Plectosphaerella plurivora]
MRGEARKVACRLPAGISTKGAATALWKPGSPHAADGHTVCCWQMTRLRMAGLPPTHHTTRHKASWARTFGAPLQAERAPSHPRHTVHTHQGGARGPSSCLNFPAVDHCSLRRLLASNAESRPVLPLLGFWGERAQIGPPSSLAPTLAIVIAIDARADSPREDTREEARPSVLCDGQNKGASPLASPAAARWRASPCLTVSQHQGS